MPPDTPRTSAIFRVLAGASILFQAERCRGRGSKTTAISGDDLRFAKAVSECLGGLARAAGGIKALARQIDVDPRTLQGWIAMEALPRLIETRRIAKACPPLADLLAREMGLPRSSVTATEIDDLRRSVDTAARVVERLATYQLPLL